MAKTAKAITTVETVRRCAAGTAKLKMEHNMGNRRGIATIPCPGGGESVGWNKNKIEIGTVK